MKRLIVLMLAGCASAPPRAMPQNALPAGTLVYVDLPSGIAPGLSFAGDVKTAVDADLRSAGVQVLPQPLGQHELHVITAAKDSSSMDGTFDVSLVKDGAVLDKFHFAYKELTCLSFFGSAECVGREIAARTLEAKLAAAPAVAAPVQAAGSRKMSGKLAVLDLRNFTRELTPQNAQYFTDVVRGAALKAQPQLEVMTRENLLVLLQASGKDLASCEGECEVDTGRRIGADLIVSGEIQKVGTKYKMTLRLHDTREGRLLASTQASGRTIDDLDQDSQRAAEELLR